MSDEVVPSFNFSKMEDDILTGGVDGVVEGSVVGGYSFEYIFDISAKLGFSETQHELIVFVYNRCVSNFLTFLVGFDPLVVGWVLVVSVGHPSKRTLGVIAAVG